FMLLVVFFKHYDAPRYLHSFPTRRSSDLSTYDVLADLKARTTRALLLTFGPAVAFNRIKLLSTNLSLKEHGMNASEGFVNWDAEDRKSTRLNSSHRTISYAVFCLKKKKD